MELGIHILLFTLVAGGIVLMGAFYAEGGNATALASVPRRLFMFLASCALLAGIMLLCEHTFASVS